MLLQIYALHETSKEDVRIFPIQLPVCRITVADHNPLETFQKFFWMVCFPGTLVFIQNDRGIRITLSGPVDPHVTFAVRRPSVLSDHNRRLIRLKYMKLIHLLVETVIKDAQITVRTLDHPVCHDLSGDMDVIPQEFLADPVKKKPIYVFGIHDACCK